MTANAPLPDDLSQWPASSFALLGLSQSASAKDAKRAYLKLVRHYKPEHEPEKFQRIRQAFEQAQQQIEFRQRYAQHWDDEPDDDDDGGPATHPAPLSNPAPETSREPDDESLFSPEAAQLLEEFREGAFQNLNTFTEPRVPSERILREPEDDLDSLWKAACRGEEARAYSGLVRMRHLAHGSSDVYAQLYWLLSADRTLDPQRSPCDWLVEGMRAGTLAGPLRELYRRELAASPLEAASVRCASLLETSAAPGVLADLLEWRWRGVSQLGRWDLILDDLRRVRPKIVFDDEETWGRMLLLAIDHLAWFEQREAQTVLDGCRQELDQLAHLHARLGDDYDRLDLLTDVVTGWQRLRFANDVPSLWTSLIPVSWNQTPDALSPKFAPLLATLGQHPAYGLRTFDAMARHSKAATAQLGLSLERLRYGERSYDDRRDNEAIKATVRRFLLRNRFYYLAMREPLLSLCITEAIDPFWVGRFADEFHQEHPTNESWSDAIAADGPLRYVYLGYRAYWG